MDLFEPLDINGMVIPNRILVPAMVTRLSGEDGHVNQDIIDRYVRYAAGNVGLIVVEAMAVHSAKSGPLLRISEDQFTAGHAELTKRVHDTSDSKVVPQIIHFMKLARSGWRQTLDLLSSEEIDQIIEQFGNAAVRAREAGYDGIELHAAHAYTLASSLSRLNPRRDEYTGRTLEGRLRMVGRVMADVRRKVGDDYPVGIRILADEYIKDGYTVSEAKLIALRLAQLGVDYISLSVGGKFEDAVHKEGEIVYPYTGYSGDRCMAGDWYPAMLHVAYAAEIKSFINSKGYQVPIVSAGKNSNPEDARSIIAEGKADIVGIARGLLADPDWPIKVQGGEVDCIVHCTYCNVCKKLDGEHKEVVCFLWPKGVRQAPPDAADGDAPSWGDDQGGLAVELRDGTARLEWTKAEGEVTGYDVYRADDDGQVQIIEAVKGCRLTDRAILAGMPYRYYIRAYDSVGRASVPSKSVRIDPAIPDYAAELGTAQ
ncbi:MAG: NADH:flavin oxidoreductase [Rhodospirillales bacterium]|jgi:2,4-dienoyl-CoA reductase-like NADH-dependent reductase (Old Yellow Enzyme family)|nr:NADH:flavin oxidoreductase [Rhodospirillales bacterium]